MFDGRSSELFSSQVTATGVWEAQDGAAVFWSYRQFYGSVWLVESDLTVRHSDGPDSPAPPMHIRRSALAADAQKRGEE